MNLRLQTPAELLLVARFPILIKNVELEFRTNLVSMTFYHISLAYLFELDFDAALDCGSVPGASGSAVA